MDPLYLLVTKQFLYILGIPYLIILVNVFCFDMSALTIALRRRKRILASPLTSSFHFRTSMTSEETPQVMAAKKTQVSMKPSNSSIVVEQTGECGGHTVQNNHSIR